MSTDQERPNSACSSIDFETELEQFYIRNVAQLPADTSDSPSKQHVYEFLPMLLSDAIECTSSPRPHIFYAFNRSLTFRSFVMHARVVGRAADSNHFHRYYIDDGSAVVELSIYKKAKELLALWRLQVEVDALQTPPTKEHQNAESLECLRRILLHTKAQLDMSNIAIGSRVFVNGRPRTFRGVTSVSAYSVFVDNGRDRGMEIAFKDHLIDWYARKYPALGVQ